MRSNTLRRMAVIWCAGVGLMSWCGPGLGAEAKRAPRQKPRITQTKRVGQGQIIAIIDGKPERAVKLCQQHLDQEPNHLESLYNLTLAWCRLNDTQQAAETMQRAIAAGLPPGRFIAGPREILAPLSETAQFRELLARHGGKPVHGPMLGCATDRSMRFWVRTAEEVPVQVIAGRSKDLARPVKSATVFSREDSDYTAVAEISALQPSTVYYYDVLLRGRSTLGPDFPAFRTFPEAGRPARFQVGFGGGAGYTPIHERMWDTIGSHRPVAFLLLGDNVYIDNPTRPDVQHYTYYRRQSRPEYRRLTASVPIFAIWDDHDFGVNDCFYGSEIKVPEWKPAVWRVFRNNWNNPAYGGGRKQPGCWFRFSIADVDFFMLDCRYYRSNPKQPDPTMLGPAQKAWLLDELKRSEATFKVLASSVPWVLDAKGNSLDTWRGFQQEREEIFSFLEEKKIDGVVLISADRHRSDLWRIDRPGGYPLYEFESSRLTNVHTHGIMPGSLFGYNRKCSFGLLGFDTKRDDPELAYQIYNIDNELIHTFVVKKSTISHE